MGYIVIVNRMRKHKSTIPEEIIDFCIDNKQTIDVAICTMLEDKLAEASEIVTELMFTSQETKAKAEYFVNMESVITAEEMEDVEKFLDNINPEDFE